MYPPWNFQSRAKKTICKTTCGYTIRDAEGLAFWFISSHWLFLRTHSPWYLSQAPFANPMEQTGGPQLWICVFVLFFPWRMEVKERNISWIWNLQLSFCCKKSLGCLLSVSDLLQLGYKFSLDVVHSPETLHVLWYSQLTQSASKLPLHMC